MGGGDLGEIRKKIVFIHFHYWFLGPTPDILLGQVGGEEGVYWITKIEMGSWFVQLSLRSIPPTPKLTCLNYTQSCPARILSVLT